MRAGKWAWVAACLLPVAMGRAATIGAWSFDTPGAAAGSYATVAGSIADASGYGNHLDPRPGDGSFPSNHPMYLADYPTVVGGGLSLRFYRSENYVIGQQRLEIAPDRQSVQMNLGPTFTLEGWARLMDDQNNTFIHKAGGTTEVSFILNQNGMSISLRDNASTWAYYTADAASNPAGSAVPWTHAGADWHHYAVTVDLGANVLRMYRDGVEYAVLRRSGTTLNMLLDDVDAAGHFSIGGHAQGIAGTSNAFYDDVRISDEVLLAGHGSGVGELAWNGSVVPEPAGIAWAGLGVGLLRRRRR